MAGQTGVPDGEWGVYGGDPGHTRYSQLDQIDSSNVEDLEIAWQTAPQKEHGFLWIALQAPVGQNFWSGFVKKIVLK